MALRVKTFLRFFRIDFLRAACTRPRMHACPPVWRDLRGTFTRGAGTALSTHTRATFVRMGKGLEERGPRARTRVLAQPRKTPGAARSDKTARRGAAGSLLPAKDPESACECQAGRFLTSPHPRQQRRDARRPPVRWRQGRTRGAPSRRIPQSALAPTSPFTRLLFNRVTPKLPPLCPCLEPGTLQRGLLENLSDGGGELRGSL